MNATERRAVADLIAHAEDGGIEVSEQIRNVICGPRHWYPAETYAALHPEDEHGRSPDDVPYEMLGCCVGSAGQGLRGCTCWEAEWNGEQTWPLQPATRDQLEARGSQCGDCAFRRDSPEMADPWMADTLLSLPGLGEPFWCHDGMRRPARWRHPAGPVVEGSPDDWQPPTVGAVPYRLDGTPGLLCHGWATRAVKARSALEATP